MLTSQGDQANCPLGSNLESQRSGGRLRVNVVHPDLGLGGAERLVLDVVKAASSLGHHVELYTAHHDEARSFEDTVDAEGKREKWIRVHATCLPRSLGGRFHAVCANVRCLWLVVVALWHSRGTVDVWFLDQVPLPLALLKLFKQKTLFYCHFPDCLLASHDTKLRWLYRLPIDYLEEACIGMADKIVVNSLFTEEVFARTFQRLYAKGACPYVVYPTASTERKIESDERNAVDEGLRRQLCNHGNLCWRETNLFLSINRFDPKKNLALAIFAFWEYLQHHQCGKHHVLVLAGGFDARLLDNIEAMRKLVRLAEELGLCDQVFFMPSISKLQKQILFERCLCILYTPENEHFGIVPLEAMQYEKVVIACNSGGPRETVIHGVTGFLCDNTPKSFANAMGTLSDSPGLAEKMGRVARLYFEQHFAAHVFCENLKHVLCSTCTRDVLNNGAARRRTSTAALTSVRLFFLLSLLLYFFYSVSHWPAHSSSHA